MTLLGLFEQQFDQTATGTSSGQSDDGVIHRQGPLGGAGIASGQYLGSDDEAGSVPIEKDTLDVARHNSVKRNVERGLRQRDAESDGHRLTCGDALCHAMKLAVN